MWKGPIILTIGIVLAFLSVPFILGYTLYDERTVRMYDFDDTESGEYDSEIPYTRYTHTFEDLSPGTITVKARDIYYGSGEVQVVITDLGNGEMITEYELDPGLILWGEKETTIERSSDYEIEVTVSEELGSYIEFEVEYSARYSKLSLVSALLGFPAFLIAGISGIIWGSVLIYRKKRGIEKKPEARYDDMYEGEESYEDEKKEEWEEYETSPRRKELWFEPVTNPYDDVSPDYYSRKAAEGKAFSKRWHQRWGDEIEERLKEKAEKMKEREDVQEKKKRSNVKGKKK
jgi:hypothetical protein